jgi:hypothetical protein
LLSHPPVSEYRHVRFRALLAIAIGGIVVSPPAVLAQTATPEFADWTTLPSGNAILTGTLLGRTVTATGGTFHPSSVLDGTSPIFAGPNFSPSLALSDAPELFGTNPATTYTIAFGTTVRDPILHLSSLASTLTFPAGTRITKRSGQALFTATGSTVAGGLPDVAGTVQLAGDFDSISFSALWTASGQPDGIDFQVGGVTVPVATPTPTPLPTVVATPVVTPVPTPVTPPPPVTGVRVTAQVATGQVLVKLPSGQAFTPLQGTASVLVGATVDARKGSLDLVAEGGDTAQVAAGIFTIRQAQKGIDRVPELVVATPAGLARTCAPGHTPPPKGIVRTLTIAANGTFRTVPAKGIVTGRNATWTTTDSCDGTLTSVRKGRVTIRFGSRTIHVRAGHRYRIAARLFGARQIHDRGGH